jgi:hypothetical protein
MLNKEALTYIKWFEKQEKTLKKEVLENMEQNYKTGSVILLKEAVDQGIVAKPLNGICPFCNGTGRA